MKKSIIISLIVMALCIVVGVVGVTAAWFGDIKKDSSTVVITSYAPKGNATMSIDSTSNYAPNGNLKPAVASEGYLLAKRNNEEWLDSIDVTSDDNLIDDQHLNRPLKELATKVTLEFDFVYAGTADHIDNEGNGRKAIAITLNTVTIANPYYFVEYNSQTHGSRVQLYVRGDDIDPDLGDYKYTIATQEEKDNNSITKYVKLENQLDNFRDEFNFKMDIAEYFLATILDPSLATQHLYYERDDSENSGFKRVTNTILTQEDIDTHNYYYFDQNQTHNWPHHMTNEYTLYIEAIPRMESRFSFTVNFARVDEETSPVLINTKLFFNFAIDVTTMEQ